MQEILELLNKEGPISDDEMKAIFEATTPEEKERYEAIVELFLEGEDIPDISDLRQAVSYFVMKTYILEDATQSYS